ncbi:hypothetical protein EIP86_008119 [Pleurotus ostreatoroseus]|nr:hypothetical protein EIP86_008119 [Pleurotus ostreatoroseus]
MVTEAAASNPELNRLLQLALQGKTNPEELQSLSQFIRSLANSPHASSPTPGAAPIAQAVPQPAPAPPPVRAFDIVIEYHERPGDRWRIPRTTAYCEKIRVGERQNVRLTLQLPFPKENVAGVPEAATLPPQIVQMHWAGLHENTVNMLIAWCGGEEKMAENWRKMQEIKQPKRTFLPYQLPEGDWLSRVQAYKNKTA